MGIITVITISKPVELRMFEQEIEVELNSRRIAEEQQKLEVKEKIQPDIDNLTTQILEKQSEIEKFRLIREEKEDF